MKNYKTLFIMFLLSALFVILILPNSLTASATGSQDELIGQIEETLNISVFYEKGADRLIKCFDVNETGWYAIGYKNNTIHVYDSLGAFQYGYRFDTDGDYGISLKENSIVIYLARSHIEVEVDSTGQCVGVEEVCLSNGYVENVMYRTYKQIGDADYYLERDIGIFNCDYSRLVRIDETGGEIFLYDVTTQGYFAGVFHYVILAIFPVLIIIFFANQIKKEERASEG